MSNEHLGIFEELQERAERYNARGREIHRRWNLEEVCQIGEPRPATPIVLRLKGKGGYHNHHKYMGGPLRKRWPEGKLGIHLHQVVQATVIESGLTHAELCSSDHSHKMAMPRQTCMWLIDRYCPEYSLTEIAYLFHRDHTTVSWAIKKTNERLKNKHTAACALVANVRQRLAVLAEGQS